MLICQCECDNVSHFLKVFHFDIVTVNNSTPDDFGRKADGNRIRWN